MPGTQVGGTLIFSSYVGSDPAFTVHPKKYQEYQAPQKIFEVLATPPKYPISVPLTIKKTLKFIKMNLKLAQLCDDPPKISTKSSYPPKIFIFLKTPKNIEIQNFEPKK